MTTDEFSAIVTDWLATTKDKRFKRFYTELVYQPMLELLSYLQINGFKTFIVSGAGQDFIRVFADKTLCPTGAGRGFDHCYAVSGAEFKPGPSKDAQCGARRRRSGQTCGH